MFLLMVATVASDGCLFDIDVRAPEPHGSGKEPVEPGRDAGKTHDAGPASEGNPDAGYDAGSDAGCELDECGQCVGGDTGRTPCIHDSYRLLGIDESGTLNSATLPLHASWRAPLKSGEARLTSAAPISIFNQQRSVWAGLTVDHDGFMDVLWFDEFFPEKGWQGPVAFGDAHLLPGAPVATFLQQPGVWAGLTVDRNGAMNVAWIDLNLGGAWRGPIVLGEGLLVPGGSVSVFLERPGVWSSLTVDRNGALSRTWIDLDAHSPWQGPLAFGDAHLSPGAPVSVFQQDTRTWALTVDRNGALNVASYEVGSSEGWQGPTVIGDGRFEAGAPVTVFEAQASVWVALCIDKSGAMNLARLDVSEGAAWHAPSVIGEARFSSAGHVAVVEQARGQWTALSVDREGSLNALRIDLHPQAGRSVALEGARLVPGAPISVLERGPGVWTALTVDRDGAINAAWLNGEASRGWLGPKALGPSDLAPGAPLSALTTKLQ